MKQISESKIQQEIVMWFNNTYCKLNDKPRLMIFSIPNGLSLELPVAEMRRVLAQMTNLGMKKGASDLMILLPGGKYLKVEVKTEVGVQSDAQKEVQRQCEDLGGKYILVRSLEDFKKKFLSLYQ